MSAKLEGKTAAGAGTPAESRAYARGAEARFERLRAPFSLRCGALLIDYSLAVVFVALSTVLARALGDDARWAGVGLLTLGYVAAATVAFLNLVVLTTFTGRTVGKWVTDLRIERRDGAPLSYGRALLSTCSGIC
jgi:uncharacterized RDD family membrane protein YckC